MTSALKPSMWWWSAAGRRVRPRPPTWRAAAIRSLLLDRAGRIKPCGGAIPPRLIQRLRHPRRRCWSPERLRPGWSRPGTATSTCRSRAASSAWSIARCSTSGCGNVPPRAGPNAATAPSSASIATPTERRVVRISCRRRREDRSERPRPRRSSAPTAPSRPSRGRRCPAPTRCPTSSPITRSSARRKPASAGFDAARCDVYYRGALSPDFYGWIFPARRHHERRHRQRAQGILTARRGRRPARRDRPRRLRDDPARGRAHPAEAAAALGQRTRRAAGRRCRGRRRARLGRGHLLRHAGGRLAADAAIGSSSAGDAKALRPARKRLHEGARPGVLDPRHHAALLVRQRQPAGAVRQHLPRLGRAAADLGRLHEQRAGARASRWPTCGSSSRIWPISPAWARHELERRRPLEADPDRRVCRLRQWQVPAR